MSSPSKAFSFYGGHYNSATRRFSFPLVAETFTVTKNCSGRLRGSKTDWPTSPTRSAERTPRVHRYAD